MVTRAQPRIWLLPHPPHSTPAPLWGSSPEAPAPSLSTGAHTHLRQHGQCPPHEAQAVAAPPVGRHVPQLPPHLPLPERRLQTGKRPSGEQRRRRRVACRQHVAAGSGRGGTGQQAAAIGLGLISPGGQQPPPPAPPPRSPFCRHTPRAAAAGSGQLPAPLLTHPPTHTHRVDDLHGGGARGEALEERFAGVLS